jgi:hypothetical protein
MAYLHTKISLAELDCIGWSKVLHSPGKLEPYLLAEFSVFSNHGKGLNDESSLREEVAEGNR